MGLPLVLTIFGVLVLAILFIGLNSVTGIILGYIATALLVVTWVRRWRRLRWFLITMVTCFAGMFFLSFIHELVYGFVALSGGIAAWQQTLLDIFHVVISITVTFVLPVFVMAGAVGSVALLVRRLMA